MTGLSALALGEAAGIHAPAGYGAVFHTGFNAFIGPVYGRFPPAGATEPAHILFDVADKHLNGAGMVHGGVLMSLCDIMLGASVYEAIGRVPAATISLNCDFVAGGRAGECIEGEARITRRTKSIVFVSGRLFVQRAGEPVILMSASGIWKVFGAT